MANKRGTIPIDDVTEEFFVRVSLSDDHVLHLAGLYDGGTKLPPILVTREHNKVIDGRHRLAALRLLNKKSVEVEWDEETDSGELIARGLRANIGGALPPTNADIVYAIQQMMEVGMVNSAISKKLSDRWPPAVVRRYIAEAQSRIGVQQMNKAKHAVVESGMTIGEAALAYKVKVDNLKSALIGKKKVRNSTGAIKSQLANIFRSRGGSLGQVMRKIQQQYEDGDISWASVESILTYSENAATSTLATVRDWRKRLEAKSKAKKVA